MSDNSLSSSTIKTPKSVPLATGESVPLAELGHCTVPGRHISEHKVKEIAIEKYKCSGYGITFEDLTKGFPVKKSQAQRSLKHFHAKSVLFTAQDLVCQGINLLENKSPQQYFPACIKPRIIENLKRRNVLVEPTGVNLLNNSLIYNTHSRSNNL